MSLSARWIFLLFAMGQEDKNMAVRKKTREAHHARTPPKFYLDKKLKV